MHICISKVSPEGSVAITPVGVVYEEGDNVTFFCTSLGGPGNSIQWLKDGESLGQGINESSSMLELTDISVTEDGAIYTCVVSNAAGNGSASVSLLISPVLVTHPMDEEIINGTVTSFICTAMAFPEPTYMWYRVDNELPKSAIGANTSTLILSPAVFGDQGDYYCSAISSGVAASSAIATLTGEPLFNVLHCHNYIHFQQYLLKEECPSHQLIQHLRILKLLHSHVLLRVDQLTPSNGSSMELSWRMRSLVISRCSM